uniref:Uncharacterized protein n=1 Tax=Strigamia maritima TaxID=126957 RepID=T1J1B5_STRMM
MKFVILLFLLSSVLSCSAESAESACFDMEKVENGSKNLVAYILQTSGVVTCTLINLGHEGKTTIEEIARQCRYDNDYRNFFPCLLNKFQASCPEIYDIFRQAVYEIGYDV